MQKIIYLAISLLFLHSCSTHRTEKHSVNAKVIEFCSDQEMCCWGWTIVIGSDTLKSSDTEIGKLVGYTIKKPKSVYIELGEIDEMCSRKSNFVYYKVKCVES